jgi:hypothetical protein
VAYEPNFYQAKNIVGYTGTIGQSPTVYFMDGKNYGHITQAHDCPMNVGRETLGALIESAAGTDINGMVLTLFYRATNDPTSGKLVEWQEKVYTPPRTPGGRRGAVVGLGYENRVQLHPSRNPFVPCDDKTRPKLEEALRFEDLKKRYTSESVFDACCGAALQGKPTKNCPGCPY